MNSECIYPGLWCTNMYSSSSIRPFRSTLLQLSDICHEVTDLACTPFLFVPGSTPTPLTHFFKKLAKKKKGGPGQHVVLMSKCFWIICSFSFFCVVSPLLAGENVLPLSFLLSWQENEKIVWLCLEIRSHQVCLVMLMDGTHKTGDGLWLEDLYTRGGHS